MNHVPPNTLLASTQCRSPSCGHRILLDNFSLDTLRKAVLMNQPKRCDLEASGGVDLHSIREIAMTGVDFISVGSITKSIQAIDLSLLIRKVI